MKDFNFFAPYIGSRKTASKDKNKAMIVLVAVVAALVVIAVPSYIQIRTMLAQRELSQSEQLLSRRDSKDKLGDLQYKEELLESMRSQNRKIESVDKVLEEKDLVGSYLIDSISEALPKDVFLDRLSIEKSGISMDCVSEQKDDIAYFENNIRRLNYFDNIFIPRISLEERFYTFSLDMQLKGEEEESDDAEIEEGQDEDENEEIID